METTFQESLNEIKRVIANNDYLIARYRRLYHHLEHGGTDIHLSKQELLACLIQELENVQYLNNLIIGKYDA